MNIALIGSIAGNTILTSLSSKLVDSLFQNKQNSKKEQKLWVRNTKLEVFSKISHEVLSCNEENIEKRKECIKKHLSKIILLIDDEHIIKTINNYLFILNEYDESKELINITAINKELIHMLSQNIYKS